MDAVIDIGSNSVRLAFMQSEVNPKLLNTTLLARNMQNGILAHDAIERTANAVIDFYLKAKAQGADKVYIFATEAVRSGKNSHLLTDKIKAATGETVHVISGDNEALVGFVGASNGQPTCIVDIGGASIELAQGINAVENGLSLPIGVMRVLEKCNNDREKIHEFYKNEVKKYPHFTYELVGIGGTATTLSAMNKDMQVYNAMQNHGSILTTYDLLRLEEIIYTLYTPQKITQAYPVVGEKRATVIGVGCIALYEIMTYLNKSSLTVSESDNIEGYYKLIKNGVQL